MNLEVVLGWLSSDVSGDRLRAARALKHCDDASVIPALESAFRAEDTSWIKTAIRESIDSVRSNAGLADTISNLSSEQDTSEFLDIDSIQSKAIEESIGQLLHEIEPIAGAIGVLAREEVPDYENSSLKVEIQLLDEMLETFEEWRKVEREPRFTQVNVYELVSRLTSKYSIEDTKISMVIEKDLIITTDKGFLGIIFGNAIRNSIEAHKSIPPESRRPIVITAGVSGEDFWASVIDNGAGLPDEQEYLLAANQSTKPGHRGMGLGLVHKALNALGGKWSLTNGASGGAEFYCEFPLR